MWYPRVVREDEIVKAKNSNSLKIPEALFAALGASLNAKDAFQALPASHQREYISWITEAKKPETQRRRAEKTVKMVVERAVKG